MTPMRAAADATRLSFKNPLNPLSHTVFGRSVTAACEVFERATRRYAKPEFGLDSTQVGGVRVPVHEEIVWSRPFCNLVHFERVLPDPSRRHPKLLIVAPMSGHYATLLRGTVEAMLPRHEVYITDWVDARQVPLAAGRFDLDDYIDYVIAMIHHLGPDVHVMAVCQPAVPVFAAVALMEEANDPLAPSSMVLMGGPIDTRANPTAVNTMAQERGLEWFERHAVMMVPWPLPGFLRRVYPGFLQLGGFMGMNLDRHLLAHREFYDHLVQGDGDSAGKHRDFYDEYLAVMDLTAEFYLDTVDKVFVRQALPKGEFMHRGRRVDPSAIRRTALLTIEGERDDISGVGQTEAAHRLAVNLPDDKRYHYLQMGVGHYGVFNGSRFRSEIAPRISDFVWTHDRRPRRASPAKVVQAAPASAEAPKPPSSKAPSTGTAPARASVAEANGAKAHGAAANGAKPNGAMPNGATANGAKVATTRGAERKPSPVKASPKAETAKAAPAKPAAEPAARAAAKPAAAKAAAAKPAKAAAAKPRAVKAATLSEIVLKKPAGNPDDLTRIRGIGAKLAETLHGLGIFHFSQLSALSAKAAEELDAKLSFPGRIRRDDWIGQAKALAGGA
ncbi:polyhydroxyalkanoate depolymerase [Pseudoxanthobacter sp. M-2]|uniref:polyhydroxyalkanoate depolymerase n=1 Tax=Pseudoxanthobacter sp. M-2 TaxID=3078754 RepID=UPI0038FC1675